MNTSSWAVCNGDAIYVNTISATRRAAIVNWLVVYGKVMVTSDATDADIDLLWQEVRRLIRDDHGVLSGGAIDAIEVEIVAK